MKRLSIVCLCTVMVVLTGCLNKVQDRSSEPVLPTSREYDGDFNAVWKATVKSCADLQLPITVIEKDSGFIGIKDFSLPNPDVAYREYTKGRVITGLVNVMMPRTGFVVTMNIYVSSSTVKINSSFTEIRHDTEFGDKKWIVPTSGVLENKLLDGIQANLEK